MPPISKTKILKNFELKENLPFNKKDLQQQATKVFEFKKDLKINENITFLKSLNLLHLDEEKYILNMINNKLSKCHKPKILDS